MSFFSRFYDFEKFPGIPREKFPNSQFFPFPWEKNLGGKTETLGMDFRSDTIFIGWYDMKFLMMVDDGHHEKIHNHNRGDYAIIKHD